jgi:hypothetical protein
MTHKWISLLLTLSFCWVKAVRAQSPPEPAVAKAANPSAREIEARPQIAPQQPTRFEQPVRLTFGGKPIEVELPGYACPTMVDFLGHGVFDLVVGQFANGNMQHFRNESTAGAPPNFSARHWLMSGKGRAEIPGIRCCTSSTPQFVDWDRDGRLDILSGCYATPGFPAGHLVLLLGEPDFKFSTPNYLTGSQGQRLQNADFSIAGDAAQRLKDSICTHAHAVDLDQDGDLDLVVGASSGNFFLYQNLGNAERPQLKQPPTKLQIQSPSLRSAPHCVDWNRDGLLDLLTGGSDGGVYLSLNCGTAAKPLWSEFEVLIKPSAQHIQFAKESANEGIQPGHSSRVWAFDWNGDGKLDLLVGDCVTLLKPAEGVTDERFQAQARAVQGKKNEMETIRAQLLQAESDGQHRLKAMDLKHIELQTKLRQITTEFQQLESTRYQWAVETKTGFVWLYQQK